MGPSILFFLAGVVAVGIAGAVYKVKPQAGYHWRADRRMKAA